MVRTRTCCGPEREVAVEMFDQDAAEPFHGAERGAVHHDRAMRFVIRPNVGKIESFGQIVIHLHRPQLPFAADHVPDQKIDLRPVEGGFARGFHVSDAQAFHRVAQRVLRLVPIGRIPDILRRAWVAQADANPIILHAQGGEDDLHQAETAHDFLRKLVLGDEQMRVVLGEPAHARQAAELAGLFPTINRAEFGQPDGHLAIGAQALGEDADVHRAVHRFEKKPLHLAFFQPVGQLRAGAALGGQPRELVVLDDGRKLRFAVIREMAGGAVDGKELQPPAEFAVVPFPGLLEHLEVSLQLGLAFESRAVDALQLRVLLVALVIGAGDLRQLERADVARAHDMRPGAEIEELPVLIVRDRLAFGDVREVPQLEFAGHRTLAERPETPALGVLSGLLARDDLLLEDMVGLDLLLHLLLDAREILRSDAMVELDVVVKPILDRRTGGELGPRPQAQDGGGQHVGAGMPDPLQLGHLVAALGRLAVVVRLLVCHSAYSLAPAGGPPGSFGPRR